VRDAATNLVKDSIYVTVGLGVLTFQRLQVRRRELERLVERTTAAPRQQVARAFDRDAT
jgi:hypothetical protein